MPTVLTIYVGAWVSAQHLHNSQMTFGARKMQGGAAIVIRHAWIHATANTNFNCIHVTC